MTTSPTPLDGGVLVASPRPSLREQVLEQLHEHSLPVQTVFGGADALVKLETGNWQVLFLDRRLPDLDAEELMGIIKRRFPGIDVLIVDSSNGQAYAVARSDKSQLQRWLRPTPAAAPPARDRVEPAGPGNAARVEAVETGTAFREPARCGTAPLPGMIGTSEAMQRVYRLARLIAPRSTTVLITGPTGTGKELVARAIHQMSPRAGRQFVMVNCAAIPEALLESELFGHTRGAFTGAVQAYPGRIYGAQGGSLFLDEVGELPLSLQAKLLRFLDHKEIQRLGSSDALHVDVRVLAATNAELEQAVERGTFRSDLYYRLAAFPLQLPPLSGRTADILPLAEHFLRQATAELRATPPPLSAEVIAALQMHAWAGNVRELQQLMERAAILAGGAPAILPQHLFLSSAVATWPQGPSCPRPETL